MDSKHAAEKKELTEIMVRDISGMLETVIRKRIGLFVEEIYQGIRSNGN